MSKLPQTASDLTREMRHRELITQSVAPERAEEARPPVDVLAVIALTGDVS